MDELTKLTGKDILLKAENARLKMLLQYVIGQVDAFGSECFAGSFTGENPLVEESRRMANGDSKELRDIIAKAVIDAVVKDRNARNESTIDQKSP